MASNFIRSTLAVNTEANAVCALLDTGRLLIYDGAQPATPNTSITSQVLIAELTFPTEAFGTAVEGVATAHSIPTVNAESYSGVKTAAWFRALTSGGVPVWDGSIGEAGSACDAIMVDTDVRGADPVSISLCRYTSQK